MSFWLCLYLCCTCSLMGVWPGGGLTLATVSLFLCLCGYLCHGSPRTPARCLTPALLLLCFSSSPILNLTTSPLPSLCVLFSNSRSLSFLAFSSLIASLPPLRVSSVCSRVMVCCGLPTQRNNISGVGKVQPHMSCAAEGRLCEVRPIPHGSYSSQPRDQRPAIPLPSSSFSSACSSSSSSHNH